MSEGIRVRIFGDDSDLQKTLAESTKRVAKYGAAAIAAGAAIAIAMTKRGLEAVDAQAKLARQLNTTSESMATLKRAGELSGVAMDKITTSARQLDVALGRASQGGNAQAAVFDRLGLSAGQLAAIPLDQRITKINEAIRRNIPAVEQASVAAELFGARNAAAMMSLDTGAMERAAREAKVFGLAISEIDAAKVESANDSFSRFGMMLEGITKQMAIQVAPILDAIGQMFFNAAEEAGGFGEAVPRAFDKTIKAVGFMADAVEVLRRSFVVLTESGIYALTKLNEMAARSAGGLLAAISTIPGIDFSEVIESIQDFERQSRVIAAEARANISEQLEAPLPSTLFNQFVDDARAAAEESARLSVQMREGLAIPVIQQEVLEAGVEDYQKYINDLAALNATWLDGLEQRLASERELMDKAFWDDLEQLSEAHEQKLIAEEDYQRLRKQIIEKYNKEVAAMEKQEADNKLALAQSIFGDISTLMNTQSRKLFEVGKAAAIANSIVDTYAGMSKALAQGGFKGIAMAAAVGARGFANISAIRSQSFGGGSSGAMATGSNTAAINAASQPVAAPSQASPMTTVIRLQGDIFGASQVRQLIEQLNEGQRDGGRIILG